MNCEYETTAEINGKQVQITVSYELDGYKPLVYGLFDDNEKDMTNEVSQAAYDRICGDLEAEIIGTLTDAADSLRGDR